MVLRERWRIIDPTHSLELLEHNNRKTATDTQVIFNVILINIVELHSS